MSDTEVTRKKFVGIAGKSLELLGSGIAANIVASTLGVSDAYISQLLSDPLFVEQVVEKRYTALSKHNARDDAYDKLEDTALEYLSKSLPMVAMDPMKLQKVVQVLNSAKRRGQASPDSVAAQTTVVNLILPNAVLNRFSVVKDSNNMIIEAGDQKLIAATSKNLMKTLESRIANASEVSDVTPQISQTTQTSR